MSTRGGKGMVIGLMLMLPAAALASGGPYYVQEHFRWRNDNGDATTATWKANTDVAATNVAHFQNIRLRFSIANMSEFGNFWPNFEYAASTNGPWASVAAASGGAFAFEFSDSSWFTNNALAGNLLAGTGTFLDKGQIVDCDGGNSDVSVAFDPSSYINAELCFRPTAKAKGGATYFFRLKDLSMPVKIGQYAALTMEAYDPPEAPVIRSSLAATVSVEKVGYGMNDALELNYRILASGSEPITYEARNLPAGYALFGDTIADDGTPSTPGTNNVVLTVRNAYGNNTKTVALTVASSQYPAYRTMLSGEVGKPFSYTLPVAGSGPVGARLDVLGGVGLPAGLTFDGVRTISGTPREAGTTRLLLTATNAVNATPGGPAARVILTVNEGSSGFAIEELSMTPYPTLSFDSDPTRLYSVECKGDLLDTNAWRALISNVTGTGGRLEISDGEGLNKRTYRLKIKMP